MMYGWSTRMVVTWGADVTLIPTIVTAAASVPTSSTATNVFCCSSDTYSCEPAADDMRVKSAYAGWKAKRMPCARMSSISDRFQDSVTLGRNRLTWLA